MLASINNESKPLVSIIIPNFNRQSFLERTLLSIQKQSYENWECIIVDDGSTDESVKIIKAFIDTDSRFKLFERPSHLPKGANSCRNLGFEKASGDFVNWFDSDDIMLSDFISTKLDAFEDKLNLVITGSTMVNENLEEITSLALDQNSKDLFKEYVLFTQKILTPSVLFRKIFLQDKKLFDYRISRGQESDFFSRIFYKIDQNSVKIIDKTGFLYVQHSTNKNSKAKAYKSSYSKSLTIIYSDNLLKGYELDDKDIIERFYTSLLGISYGSLVNKDFKIYFYNFRKVFLILFQKNPLKLFQFIVNDNMFKTLKYLFNKHEKN